MMAEECEVGEGKQAQLLRLILRKIMEDVTQNLKISEVFGNVPGISKKKLTAFSKIFNEHLLERLEEVVNSLFEGENMDQLLKRREELIEAQKGMEGSIAWRPSGSVEDDMRSHNLKILREKRKQLTALCEMAEQEADTLFARVQEARSKALHVQKQLAASQDQLKKLNELIKSQEEAQSRIADSLVTL